MSTVDVNGLSLKEKALYKIVDKIDNNALEGLKQYGSTKYPQEYMATLCQCPFDKTTKTYDTGFYIQSPCYKGMDKSNREKIVNLLHELIVEPYERVYGLDILDNKNEKFWSEYNVDLEEGRIFNTSNVKDMLDLYIAMRAYELTPRNKVGDPRFSTSQFVIEDRDVTNKKRNERKQNYMSALESFFIMLKGEKHKLIAVLKYCYMSGADSFTNDTNDSTINSLFKDWIDSDVKHIDNFLRVSKMVDRKTGMEEVSLFSLLLELNKKKKLIKVGEEFTYEDIPLGADLKTCAKNLSSKRGLKDLKDKILELETSS